MRKVSKEIIEAYNKQRPVQDKRVLCHAPFNSLYFSTTGEIIPCCHNPEYLFGKYPGNSIMEAWCSQEAAVFRETIKANILKGGCSICRNQLEAGNFKGVHAALYDRELVHANPVPGHEGNRDFGWLNYPEILEFELSNICNLECTMCQGINSHLIRKNREGLPALHSPYDPFFVAQLREFVPYVKIARFLGGEPFLIPIYYDIWEVFRELNPEAEIHITTNATVWNNRIHSVLQAINVFITVSIDSLDESTYESIRLNGKFNTVRTNIERFLEYGKEQGKTTSITVCPIRENWKEIPDLLSFAIKESMNFYINTVVDPFERSLRSMSAINLQQVIDNYKQRHNELSEVALTPQGKESLRSFHNLIGQIASWLREKQQGYHLFRGPLDSKSEAFSPSKDYRSEIMPSSNGYMEGMEELIASVFASPDGEQPGMDWRLWGFYDLYCGCKELDGVHFESSTYEEIRRALDGRKLYLARELALSSIFKRTIWVQLDKYLPERDYTSDVRLRWLQFAEDQNLRVDVDSFLGKLDILIGDIAKIIFKHPTSVHYTLKEQSNAISYLLLFLRPDFLTSIIQEGSWIDLFEILRRIVRYGLAETPPGADLLGFCAPDDAVSLANLFLNPEILQILTNRLDRLVDTLELKSTSWNRELLLLLLFQFDPNTIQDAVHEDSTDGLYNRIMDSFLYPSLVKAFGRNALESH